MSSHFVFVFALDPRAALVARAEAGLSPSKDGVVRGDFIETDIVPQDHD